MSGKQLRSIIRKYVPKERLISLREIYEIVESHARLNQEDLAPESGVNKSPMWKKNVRNCLLSLRRKNEIQKHPKKPLYTFNSSELFRVGSVADVNEPAEHRRLEYTICRVVRDTQRALWVKNLHKYRCQICGLALELGHGELYAEGHHIKPLGDPHNGPDVKENILCVCPNHHVLLDFGAIWLDFVTLRKSGKHRVDRQHIDYYNSRIFRNCVERTRSRWEEITP